MNSWEARLGGMAVPSGRVNTRFRSRSWVDQAGPAARRSAAWRVWCWRRVVMVRVRAAGHAQKIGEYLAGIFDVALTERVVQ